uniref:NADH-ubiquinone oxidoreductase chain 4 n=1 Tax=Rhinogobius cliffordpopei TaxID=1643632 RepID=A0A162BW68_9GOBI|nr:NADH dehydrogenase subunit 4 [Rhinogobius cliffordpopei]
MSYSQQLCSFRLHGWPLLKHFDLPPSPTASSLLYSASPDYTMHPKPGGLRLTTLWPWTPFQPPSWFYPAGYSPYYFWQARTTCPPSPSTVSASMLPSYPPSKSSYSWLFPQLKYSCFTSCLKQPLSQPYFYSLGEGTKQSAWTQAHTFYFTPWQGPSPYWLPSSSYKTPLAPFLYSPFLTPQLSRYSLPPTNFGGLAAYWPSSLKCPFMACTCDCLKPTWKLQLLALWSWPPYCYSLGATAWCGYYSFLEPLTKELSYPFIVLALWGVIMTGSICLRQTDLKSLIAYSSVGHMGLVAGGILIQTPWGFTGALILMVAHGLTSSALFCLANTNYERTHTRTMVLARGMQMVLPLMTCWWFLASLANLALPPLPNLMGELMIITSLFNWSWATIALTGAGTLITAGYSLYMFLMTQRGPTPHHILALDPSHTREHLLLALHLLPLLLLIANPALIWGWTS